MDDLPRVALACTPTPLEPLVHLSRAWGGPRIWVKRDDLTGFELSGNKVRKLEYHLGAALADGADVVVTAGAEQSNHCRATALAAARLGLGCVLVLRTPGGQPPAQISGNHLLHHLSGARIELVDADGYRRRDEVMARLAEQLAADGRRPWIVPEGASDALGMLGMADGFDELEAQLADAGIAPAGIWHAASSAGTTAGFGWAAARNGSSVRIIAISVGEPPEQLQARVEAIWSDATARHGVPVPQVPIEYRGDFIGGGYGVFEPDQRAIEADATARTGLLFDPTYTGKALYGLRQEIASGRFGPGDDVVFWHTGGGFAVFASP